MLRVAVCDDDPICRGRIQEEAGKILFSRCEYEIVTYADGIEIEEAVENGAFLCQLLLLDIYMKRENGLKTAQWLRKRRVDVDIIFITASEKYVYECYTYKAFAYILKPAVPKRLRQELDRYLDEIRQNPGYLNILVRGEKQRILLDDILYFESELRKIRVHMKKGGLEFYGKLDELEETLKEQPFFRCHQSYLVNRNYVGAIRRSGVTVEGRELPVSRKYWEILRKKA